MSECYGLLPTKLHSAKKVRYRENYIGTRQPDLNLNKRREN